MARLRLTSVDSKEKLRRLADEELMELVAGNDADAFEVVLERHTDAAFALAYRICGRRSVAEDIAQEAFLAVWRSGARYDRARGSVRTWTLGIVHNRAVDALRRSNVHERRRISDEGIEETLEAAERTEAQAVENATSREIRGALGELPSEQRRVIELAYFGGFTHVEIASMLGAPVGTVKGRMRLGLCKLRDRLQDWETVAHESA
jgi:RNA polymerase sigma-70 factor, ECF subfamily